MKLINGQKLGKDFGVLATLVERGDMTVKTAPEIDDTSEPEAVEIVVPEVKIRVGEGKTGLRLIAEKIKAQKVAQRVADQERVRLKNEELQKRQGKVRTLVRHIMEQSLPGIHEIMTTKEEDDVGEDLLGQPSPYPRDDGKELTISEQLEEWKNHIDRYKKHQDLGVALPVIATEAIFWLSVTPLTSEELKMRVEDLTEERVLRPDVQGEICLFQGARFSLDSRFDALDLDYKTELGQAVAKAIHDQVRRIKDERAETEKQLTQQFLAQATMHPIDFFEEKEEGVCCFPTKNGCILAKATKDHVQVLNAFGEQMNGFLILQRLEKKYATPILLERQSLKNGLGQLRSIPPDGIYVPSMVLPKDRYEWENSYRFIWHWCRNGMLHNGFLTPELDGSQKVVRTFKKINRLLTDEQFYHQPDSLGRYVVKLETWKWRFKDGRGVLSQTETVIRHLELEFERFEDVQGATRLKINLFSPEHKDFLERVACLEPNGYLTDPAKNRMHPFFDRVLRTHHAIKFPPTKW